MANDTKERILAAALEMFSKNAEVSLRINTGSLKAGYEPPPQLQEPWYSDDTKAL